MDGSYVTYNNFEFPKPLILFLIYVDLIYHTISVFLHRIGLYPSFQRLDYPWDEHMFVFSNTESRRRRRSSSSSNTGRRPSLMEVVSDMKSRLPVVEYEKIVCGKSDDEGSAAFMCAVCLSEFEGKEEVREMGNCKHVFHMGCIDQWMDRGKLTCPLCRTQLLPDDDEDDKRGEGSCRGFTVKFMRRKFW